LKKLGWLLVLLVIPVIVFGAMNPFLPIYSNPYSSYEVISTPYLNVVYQPGCEYAVNEFLKYADEVYTEMTNFYGIQPSSKLTVVFENDTDVVNSVTDPVDNVIFIFLNSSADQYFSPSISPWVEFVFTHELTHILLTQKGGPDFLRTYGAPLSTAFNALIIPAYFQEGLAEYTETIFNNGRGRLNDPMFEMYLREYVLAGRLNGLGGSINYGSDGWDPAGSPYLIGGSFIRYIAQTYGATSIQNIVSNFSKDPNDGIPSAISKTLKKNFSDIISAWISSEKQNVNSAVANVGNVFEGIQLTHSGRWTGLVNGSNGGKLYYYSENASSVPSIMVMNTLDMSSKNFYDVGGFVYDNGYVQSLSVSPNGNNVAFTRIVPQNGGNFDYDRLFLAINGNVSNTSIDGVLMTTWLSNDQIAYVNENGGLYSIKILNYKSGLINTVLGPTYMVITSINSFGGKIYFSASYDGKEEIYEIDGGNVYKIVSGNYLMRSLTFSQDGNYIIFSSAQPDANGIFNLYALNFQNGQFYRITNVIGGAFAPQIVENRLFYAGYTTNGYNLFVIDGWKDRLVPISGIFTFKKVLVDSSVNLMNVSSSIQNISKPYSDDLKTLAFGMIPTLTLDGTSLVYSMGGFALLRDTLGQNTVYAGGNISSSATYDYLGVGLVHYGKTALETGFSLSPQMISFSASLGVPLTGLIFNKDFLFYPSVSYTVSATQSLSSGINMSGAFYWAPSSIPDNSAMVIPFYLNWNVGFSGQTLIPNGYTVKTGTSFPFIGTVVNLGLTASNSDLLISQSMTLQRLYLNFYDVTGTAGLRYVDFSQFSSYDLSNGICAGLSANLGIDSIFNQTIPLEIYGYYNFKEGKFEYGINLGL